MGDDFFVRVAEKTFAELGLDFLKDSNVSISLALVSPEEIRNLNKEYRKYDSVTDILSFAEYENMEEVERNSRENSNQELFLGELILCYDDIMKYTQDEGIKFERELAKVVSHGILHLLGFSHGEGMFSLQEKVADNF